MVHGGLSLFILFSYPAFQPIYPYLIMLLMMMVRGARSNEALKQVPR
jgi:hypothetical protein